MTFRWEILNRYPGTIGNSVSAVIAPSFIIYKDGMKTADIGVGVGLILWGDVPI